jgi:hypothetical protein
MDQADMGNKSILFILITSSTRPRVAVAHSGEMEEKEVRGSARFTYVSFHNACGYTIFFVVPFSVQL